MEFIKNSAECHPEEPDLVLEMVWFGAGGLNRLSKVFLKKKNIKKTLQLSGKKPSSTATNSYNSNIFHILIGRKRFGLLGMLLS